MPKHIESESLLGGAPTNAVDRVTIAIGPALLEYLKTRASRERRFVTSMARILLVDSMHQWYREQGLPMPG